MILIVKTILLLIIIITVFGAVTMYQACRKCFTSINSLKLPHISAR